MDVFVPSKNKDDLNNNESASGHKIFPTITLWELHVSVAMETRVLIIRSGPKLNAAFPHPNDTLVKI